MDYATLFSLREHHPAWRLLAAQHAPLIASFLHRTFVQPNVRVMSEANLTELLEDALFTLREQDGTSAYPKGARDYLTEWAAVDKGWLRKFYKPGTDEAQFDLTPATEKAIAWLVSLTDRPFVGTESRLLTLFTLLEQIQAGTEVDPRKRVTTLLQQRDEIDQEIARVEAGDMAVMDATAIKDRFLQFQQLARELLGDFREVEQNFRQLDRQVREKIALWEGSKGELLDEILGATDAIGTSDQGRSFRAFWDFLMSRSRQETLTEQLALVLALPPVLELKPEPRLRRIHHDWLEAGEHTQRTVAQLSQQLRHFLDDRAFLDNRRILTLMRGIESKALALRACPPSGTVHWVDDMGAEIFLPLERPLFTPTSKPKLADLELDTDDIDVDTRGLFAQVVIDKAQLRGNIQRALRQTPQVSLSELIQKTPLQLGLAELVAYLELAHGNQPPDDLRAMVDDHLEESICWTMTQSDGVRIERCARLPRVIFLRGRGVG